MFAFDVLGLLFFGTKPMYWLRITPNFLCLMEKLTYSLAHCVAVCRFSGFSVFYCNTKPAIQRVHRPSSLTFRITRACCHSNETRAPIANPPRGIPLTIPPKLHSNTCRDRHTDRTAIVTEHFAWQCLCGI